LHNSTYLFNSQSHYFLQHLAQNALYLSRIDITRNISHAETYSLEGQRSRRCSD